MDGIKKPLYCNLINLTGNVSKVISDCNLVSA